jgi:hypothetical protein
MSASSDSGGRIAIPVLLVVLVVLAAPILVSVAGRLLASDADEPFLETAYATAAERARYERMGIPVPEDRTCDGRPREFMRFHHMDLLKEIRDEVLREGIGIEVSRGLERCRTCHENRERFCNACHDAVDLSPDCFDCHYYPADGGE